MHTDSDWLQADFDLTGRNTLAVPSVAQWYAAPSTLTQLRESLTFARTNKIAVTILGSGSNVVLPERLDGMVLRPMFSGIRVLNQDSQYLIIEVGAGEDWSSLVRHSMDKQWYGLENLASIPGSVGAAPVQNIGAYGVEIASCIHKILAVNVSDGALEEFAVSDCGFSYRQSMFRHTWRDQKIIVAVQMRLRIKEQPHTEYASLRHYLEQKKISQASALQVYRAVVDLRRRLPDVSLEPNVGSFFVNPELEAGAYQTLLNNCPTIKAWPQPKKRMRISAGDLLERCGWKGKVYQQIHIHKQHALVIINSKGCSGSAVMDCARAMRASVAHRFDIHLAVEPRVVNLEPA